MKTIKNGLRIWIATTSVASFMGGWALLAHAPKPAPTINQPTVSTPAPLPTLAPLPPLNSSSNSRNTVQQLQPIQPQPSFSFRPRLRTSGS